MAAGAVHAYTVYREAFVRRAVLCLMARGMSSLSMPFLPTSALTILQPVGVGLLPVSLHAGSALRVSLGELYSLLTPRRYHVSRYCATRRGTVVIVKRLTSGPENPYCFDCLHFSRFEVTFLRGLRTSFTSATDNSKLGNY